MPESCKHCGAELYEGQQFCRRCGAQVRGPGAAAGEAPTQLFAAGAPTAAAPAHGTSPLGGGARTDSVARQPPPAYQPPLASFQQTSPLPAGAQSPAPPARRRRGAWLAALFVVFILGAGLASGAAYLWWRAAHQPRIIKRIGSGTGRAAGAPAAPEVPGVPADLGDRIKEAMKGAGVPLPLDESGAAVSGEDTVLTRAYELDAGSSLSVRAVTGSVTVVGTEEGGDRAVVKIIKHGGSERERAGTRVLLSQSEEGLALISASQPGGRVSISYEIRVPRNLRQLEISADRGDVRVSEFDGAVVADVRAGELEFRGLSGRVRSKLIKGNTRVFYTGPDREGAQEFSVVKGNIEATVAGGAGADLKAETLDGEIVVDEGFGLRVEKAPAGRRASGRLGEGGEALLFKVTDGDIRLKK